MINLQEQLKRTPLYDEHVGLKARIVPFGGWDMPVQYYGILDEYKETRTRATIFDTCHMGEFLIEGDAEAIGLDRLVTMPIKDMPLKTARYGFILNPAGGVIDDLIVFRVAPTTWFIVVNAGTIAKDAAHFEQHLKVKTAFRNISAETGKIDLQGPLSRDVLKKLASGIETLDYFSFDYFNVMGEKVIVSRTGYTGELGYEIFFPAADKRDQIRDILLG